MNETQFRRFYGMASKMPGQTGHNFLQILERRLDNVLHRMGFGVSRSQSRQIVRHGHVLVNGRKLDIPSYLVRAGDVVAIAEKSRDIVLLKDNAEVAASRAIPAWIELNAQGLEAKIISLPVREQIDSPVNEQLVVEFYAR
jgi:small subunit ribosomal protein S4